MPLRLVAVSFDAHDPAGLAVFWAGVLGRAIVGEASGALLPGDDTQVGLRFVAAATEKAGQNRLHLHLTSSTARGPTAHGRDGVEARRPPPRRGAAPGGGPRRPGRPRRQRVLRDRAGEQLPRRLRLPRRGLVRRHPGGRPVLARRTRVAARVGPGRGDRRPVAARRHQGLVGRSARGPQDMGGTGSASTSLRPTSLRRWSDWSRSVRPSSATATAASSWPTPTATNS